MMKKTAPPPYQSATNKSPKLRTPSTSMMPSDPVTCRPPKITHKVIGGELAQTSVGGPTRELEEKIKSVQSQVSALTHIIETEKMLRRVEEESQNERHMLRVFQQRS
ncbi:hypothetical protein NL108_016986 [Boleophthalmus pectinirostris]|nr:hypothetical protein NL108_016986 [Boleophthalmus pectinirostris]